MIIDYIGSPEGFPLFKRDKLSAVGTDVRNFESGRLSKLNVDAIAVVGVKCKAHKNDLDKLDRKMKHFKQLFLIYQSFKQYVAMAASYINDDAKEEALDAVILFCNAAVIWFIPRVAII